jgi:thiol:disulfide interchange protein DsbD
MRARNALLLALAALLSYGFRLSAKEDPVQWSLAAARGSEQIAPGGGASLDLKATIQDGWHLYSPTTPLGGPIVTKIKVDESPAISSWQVFRPKPVRKLDPNFNIDTETYAGQAVFLVDVTAAKSANGMLPVSVSVRYQACSDVKCLPPVKKTVTTQIATAPGSAPVAALSVPEGYAEVPAAEAAAPKAAAAVASPQQTRRATTSDPDLLPFLLTAFGAGLLALFTPCVFPMIPITVSFFLNQNQAAEKRSGLAQAIVFCTGIVVLFTGLGFLVTAVAGPFGVVQLGSSPWVNGFIALVFLVFGLSLLGAFELRLPSGLLTSLDRASQGGGYGGSLLMGLTFSLTSFACIGPIVGPLLIASVQSKGLQPVLGMLAFAVGLALPFFLLALFPAYLKKLPRSGGWMTRVKVVLGFIVLAAMLKYLSNIDQVLQTHLLPRERFLAAWIVLFALPGLYLLGFLRLEGIKKDDPLGVGRTLLAAAFLIFSISLVPGLFGARLGDLDAYVPEGTANTLAAGSSNAVSPAVFKNNLEGALSAARAQNKLVLINFTGYACTNCHWMKANMFTRPEIAAALNNLILVDLYTDGTDDESDKNQKLEDQKFNTASVPFYAIVDPDQNVIATFPQLTRDAHEFLAFLTSKPSARA